MRIGPYILENNLILAPMAGVTDAPFRRLCRSMGAGLAVSEMITADTSLWASRKSVRRLQHSGEPAPRSVQIAGSDPGMMAEAARRNMDAGAHIIDINMGCPAKKVCNVMAGSALMKDEVLVGRILQRVVNAVDIPVTLKMRTGWDPDHRNALGIARIAELAGIQALAVHGRTRACAYRGQAEYQTIAAVKAGVTLPVIANGDINSGEKAAEVLRCTGADALMIGRGAQGNPWIFREIADYLTTGVTPEAADLSEVRTTIIDHLAEMYAFYGEYTGVRMARKHLAWYSRGYRKGAAFRAVVNRLESAEAQQHAVNVFFDGLEEDGAIAA